MAALAPDDTFVCFADHQAARALDLQMANVELRQVDLDDSPTVAAASDSNRSLLDLLRMTWAVARGGIDVFFSPSVYTYFPLPPRMRAVVTVHDAIAERFPELTLPSWRARAFWRMKVLLALKQARIVLTVSDFAAADIARVLGVDARRIRVALEAPAAVYNERVSAEVVCGFARHHGLPAGRGLLVYVGGLNPHKNVDLLVRAHAALVRERPADAPDLVFVGPTSGDVFHSHAGQVRALIAELGTAAHVHWLAFLADEQLRLLHAGALALVLPSACEGFGLPAVEAAACGAPVIATTESPLPQLLAGGGLFVPPGDLDALTVALRTLSFDPTLQRAMGARARIRASELSWTRGAAAALSAVREAAA